ncbi:MAG: hypothetical protein KDC98_13530 [Planctomycetes bacterium]|nr:hypothetical protein [Planctomycetota bacterium]
MSIRREGPVSQRLLTLLQKLPPPDRARCGAFDGPIAPHSSMTRRQDLVSRAPLRADLRLSRLQTRLGTAVSCRRFLRLFGVGRK